MFGNRRLTLVFPAALTILLGACASSGATFRSGVGDAFPDRAPYYSGKSAGADPVTLRIAHVPVAYQRGTALDPASGPDMQSLLTEMSAFLDSTVGTLGIPQIASASGANRLVPPDVYFGCITATSIPGDDCAERGHPALGRGKQQMRLAVGRPSKEWIAATCLALHDAEMDAVLVVTIEVGQYLVRQSGALGTKSVELGTGRTESLPWLTSLETPVSVLQITGALIGRDGKAIRIGAEGLLARRTSLPISALGAQRVISEADVAEVRTLRREDLPGTPLVWQVALRSLAQTLIGD